MYFGDLHGRYHGDYFGPLARAFAIVVFGQAWLEHPHAALDISHALAMLDVDAQPVAPHAVGIVHLEAPSAGIEIAHAIGIAEVEAEPYEEP